MKKSKLNRRVLGIASTPYHLMVFLFIKDAFLTDIETDILLTDKTPSLLDLYENKKLEGIFPHVFFADGKTIKNPYKGGMQMLYESMISNPDFAGLFPDGNIPDIGSYSDIFFASPGMPDEISKEIIKSAVLKNRRVRFHRFEDGFASYTKPPMTVHSQSSARSSRALTSKKRRTDCIFSPRIWRKWPWQTVPIPALPCGGSPTTGPGSSGSPP